MLEKLTSWVFSRNRALVVDAEELTALELLGRVGTKTNEVVDMVNTIDDRETTDKAALQTLIAQGDNARVTIADLENNRKLSPSGNFTGTWWGLQPIQSDAGLAGMVNAHLGEIVSVKLPPAPMVGAVGDGVADDTAAIQAIIDSLPNGGVVFFPPGVYRVSTNINIHSNIILKGSGWTNTFIKPLNTAVIPADTGIVQTKDFLPGRNVWNYYQPYPTGLHMGVGLEDLTIDGNRANQGTGNGLSLYAGKFTLNRIGVINTADHGIVTECGIPGNSETGSDLEDFLNMHESSAKQVYIANANKRGWWYKGPNDSYLDNLQIKDSGWASFYVEDTAASMAMGLKIGQVHCYGSNYKVDDPDAYMYVINTMITVDKMYVDTPSKSGVYFKGNNSYVNRIHVTARNSSHLANGWGVYVEGSGITIGSVKLNDIFDNTVNTDGGGVWVKGARCSISEFYHYTTGTAAPTVALQIDGDDTNIGTGLVNNMLGGTGLIVSSKQNSVNLIVDGASKGFWYKNADSVKTIANKINLQLFNCTTPEQYDGTVQKRELITVVGSSGLPVLHGSKQLDQGYLTKLGGLELNQVLVTPAGASYTIADATATYYYFSMSQNFMVNNPTIAPAVGKMLILSFNSQAGGFTLSFGDKFKTSYPNPDSAPAGAYKRSVITFVWEGTFWLEVCRTNWL